MGNFTPNETNEARQGSQTAEIQGRNRSKLTAKRNHRKESTHEAARLDNRMVEAMGSDTPWMQNHRSQKYVQCDSKFDVCALRALCVLCVLCGQSIYKRIFSGKSGRGGAEHLN
jgi:hypothetical protein